MGNDSQLRYECLRPTSCKIRDAIMQEGHRFLGSINDLLESEYVCTGSVRVSMISAYPLMAVRSSTSLWAISLVR